MTTVAIGRQAEVAATKYLTVHGYKILDQNWRTRYCEIDVIAKRDKIIHFVEVKYRVRDDQGSGLEFVTPTKLHQMQFAAELWVQEHAWRGDYCLSALEVSGPEFRVTAFVKDCT